MQNSESNNSNNWLIPLLAAFAIYFPLSSTSSPDQKSSALSQSPSLIQMIPLATPTPAPTPGSGWVPGEAAKLLCDFFGAKPDLDQDAQGRNSDQKRIRPTGPQDFAPKNLRGDYCRIKSIRDLNKVEYLIATVPDPKDTRLDYMFDRYLDVIQVAIGDAGYTFDSYWLPWDRSGTAAPVSLPADPKMPQMSMATRYLYDPGVILFRGDKRLLLLFVVGETPTGGIHKVAFQNALWQIEELAGWRESKTKEATEKELRILSPSFSGSADSLATLLNPWIHEYEYVTPPKVRIVSGSATSIDKSDLLKKIPGNGVDFQSTVIHVEEANGKFFNYLSHLDPQSNRDGVPHIALLSEASTGHGKSVRELEDKKRIENQLSPDAESKSKPQVLSLTFPLHISQLRVEAARQSPLRGEAAKALAAGDSGLALPMREAGSPASKDILPLFSPVETVTMELALGEALSAIHRERIRYVGVMSTDVQDRIFLVREIRKHCPNAMIFIQTDDLLYLHSESNLDFQGSLVISSYPLFGLNQLWTYPFAGGKSRLQFSTYTAQGVYNATLALLNKEDRTPEDQKLKNRMLEYGFPLKQYKDGENRYPALWLGIIGRNGIWPVKTFDLKTPPGEKSYTLPVSVTSSSSGGGNNAAPQLGLSRNFWSPTGIGILLLVGGACLFLPLVFLAQSILFLGRSKVDKVHPDQWREGRSKLSRAIIERILELEREIQEGNVRTWLRPFAWVRRGWVGQVFGDEEFYCYRMDRRINLMSCCVSLVAVTLFISSVAMLPAWIRWEMTKGESFETRLDQDLAFGAIAGVILVFALAAFLWLAASIIWWMISGWRHFLGRIGALLALFVGAMMIAFAALGLIEILRAKPEELLEKLPQQIFFFLRATELASGVSILLPGLLIGLAVFLSFFAALRRLNLAERMPCLREPQQRLGDAPQFLRFDHEGAKSFMGLKLLEDRVKETIVCRIIEVPGAAMAVFVIFILYWRLFLQHFIPSVDGWAFDMFFKLGFYIAPLLLAWAFLRFIWLWAALRRLLRRLSWHPLISQYAAEHSEENRFALLPLVDLMTHTPTYTALSASTQQARSFYNALKLPPEHAETGERIRRMVEEAESKLSHALQFDAQGAWQEALRNRRDAQATLAELTEPVAGLLEDSWLTPDGAGHDAGWRDEGKFFLITHIMAFLQHVFAQLQNLVALVTIGLLLLLVAANSYPFRPREPLLLFSWVAILASVVVTLLIFVQVNRDKTLSLLTGKTPGRLNITRDFVMRVMIHAVVPIIALLGAQFPQTVRQIFSWLSAFQGKGG